MNAPTKAQEVVVRIVERLADIPAAKWDALANPDEAHFDPFLTHAFLSACEESGSATRRTGWRPQHLIIEDKNGALEAAMPLYIKTHSRGEYIFDHGWANAFERAGGHYYPKLLCAVPFTPATGQRLLTRVGGDRDLLERQLLAGAIELCQRADASSFHINFPNQEQYDRLGALGLLQRTDQQFMWQNHGYETFDDFLGELASRKRKAIKREREGAVEGGITIEHVTGKDLTEAHWDAFFQFYTDTGSRKWGSPYLNRKFFSLINETIPDRILLVMCKRAGRYIAGALNFIGGEALYGRYWGAIEHHNFLHFETCYYQAIDFAIQHKIGRVEAGAQGSHKLARGYLPTKTYSLHFIRDPGFADAVKRYLAEERREVDQHIDELSDYGPFRRGGHMEEQD
ncbi:MAG: GNAT family N-acetyltransferase [Alphaproteobacteria bacterium]